VSLRLAALPFFAIEGVHALPLVKMPRKRTRTPSTAISCYSLVDTS
jgi:hypothetical protein